MSQTTATETTATEITASQTTAVPTETEPEIREISERDVDAFFRTEDLWAVIVWNDDVNTFDHVITALVEILHHTPARADQLAQQVHDTGKAVVGIRPKDEATWAVVALHRRGIQASLDRA
jgi:ATP-dependent Clp protease adaptor protein ClpS